jgi:hypothetical protein
VHPRGEGEGNARLQPLENQNLRKNTDSVVTMISNVLLVLPFSQNQPLHLAVEQYIRILKKKIKNVYVLDEI